MNTTKDGDNGSFIIDMSQIMDEMDEKQTHKSNAFKSIIYTLSKEVIYAFAMVTAAFIVINAFYYSETQSRALNGDAAEQSAIDDKIDIASIREMLSKNDIPFTGVQIFECADHFRIRFEGKIFFDRRILTKKGKYFLIAMKDLEALFISKGFKETCVDVDAGKHEFWNKKGLMSLQDGIILNLYRAVEQNQTLHLQMTNSEEEKWQIMVDPHKQTWLNVQATNEDIRKKLEAFGELKPGKKEYGVQNYEWTKKEIVAPADGTLPIALENVYHIEVFTNGSSVWVKYGRNEWNMLFDVMITAKDFIAQIKSCGFHFKSDIHGEVNKQEGTITTFERKFVKPGSHVEHSDMPSIRHAELWTETDGKSIQIKFGVNGIWGQWKKTEADFCQIMDANGFEEVEFPEVQFCKVKGKDGKVTTFERP